jgi:hypothetical protein
VRQPGQAAIPRQNAGVPSTERICFGVDIDPRYIDVAVQRWQKLTGQVAVLAADGRTFDQIAAERTVVEVA